MCFFERKGKSDDSNGEERKRERREGKEKEKVRKRRILHKNQVTSILSRKKPKGMWFWVLGNVKANDTMKVFFFKVKYSAVIHIL